MSSTAYESAKRVEQHECMCRIATACSPHTCVIGVCTCCGGEFHVVGLRAHTLLLASLGGNCRTAFVVTLNPESEFLDVGCGHSAHFWWLCITHQRRSNPSTTTQESISTCRFAQRCSMLSHQVIVNEEKDPAVVAAKLQREVNAMKKKLAKRKSGNAVAEHLSYVRSLIPVRPPPPAHAAQHRVLTPGELRDVERRVAEFIRAESVPYLVTQDLAVARESSGVLKVRTRPHLVVVAHSNSQIAPCLLCADHVETCGGRGSSFT